MDAHPNEATPSCAPQEQRTRRESRRELLRAAAAAAPLLLTLKASPVLGAQCISPSQTLSGALSHRAQKVGDCNGRPAAFYLDNPGSWGLAYPTPDTAFYSVFYRPAGTSLFVKPDGSSFTFLEVLAAHTGTAPDPGEIGFHMVGAYLNILNGLVDPIAIDAPLLLQMWAQYASNGFFRPFPWNPAIEWHETEIVSYLVNNVIAP